MRNLFLDDTRQPKDIYGSNRKWELVTTTQEVKDALLAGEVNNLSLDHDLGRDQETGYDLVKWMAENNQWPKGEITVHSANPVGAANMRAMIDRYRPPVGKVPCGCTGSLPCNTCGDTGWKDDDGNSLTWVGL